MLSLILADPVPCQLSDSAAIYLHRARFMTDSGTPSQRDSTLALWRRAAELYRAGNDTLRQAEAWQEAGRVYYRNGIRSDSAGALLLRAATLFHEAGELSREARALLDVVFIRPHPDTTRNYAADALALYRKAGDRRGETTALVLSGLDARKTTPQERLAAMGFYRQALALAREISYPEEELRALDNIGETFNGLTIPAPNSRLSADSIARLRDSTLFYYHAGLVRATELSNASEIGSAIFKLSLYYQGLTAGGERNLDSAAKYLHLQLDGARRSGNKSSEMSALSSITRFESTLGRGDSARAYALRTLALARELGGPSSRSTQTTALTALAENDLIQGWPDSAIARYRELARLSASSPRPFDALISWRYLGGAHLIRGATDSALFYYRRVREFLASNPPIPNATPQSSELDLGDAHIAAGNTDSAEYHYREAARISSPTVPPGPYYTSFANTGIGRVYSIRGIPDSAAYYFARAAEYGNVMLPTNLNYLGNIDLDFGAVDSAFARQRRALDLFRGQPSPSGVAATLGNLAAIYDRIGRPDSALALYRLALANDVQQVNRQRIVNRLISIASVYLNGDYPDSALVYQRRALAVAREMDAPVAQPSPIHALGVTFAILGQNDSADFYVRRAAAMWREQDRKQSLSTVLTNLASVRSRAVVDDSVFALLREAIALARRVQSGRSEGTARSYLAAALVATNRADSAIAEARESLRLMRIAHDRAFEGRSLATIARAKVALGQPDSARYYYNEGIRIMRAAGFARGVREALAEMAELFRTRSGVRDLSRAAAYYDSAAAVAADARRSAGGDFNAVSLLEQQTDIFGGWARTWIGRAATVGSSRSTLAALGAVERGRAQGLLDLVRKQSSRAPMPRVGSDLAAEADSLLEVVRTSHSAALSYLHAGDTLFIWLVASNGQVSLYERPLPAAELERLVRSARTALGGDESRGAELSPDDVGPVHRADSATTRHADDDLRRLADLLLPEDLETRVGSGTAIIVVPHGPIGLVPFAALEIATPPGTAKKRAVLGARHPVRYAPSFAALRATVERPTVIAVSHTTQRPAFAATRPTGAARQNVPATHVANALIVGNPTMPYVYSGRWTTRSQLRPLPGAEAESRSVAGALGAAALTGAAATEKTVRSRMASAPLIHFATHGFAYGTSSSARRSFIAFAPDATNDGLLTLGELMDDASLTLKAELVVLSACQSGLGDLKQAEGTVGLQRAFLAKGARSVLVSLWNVDDRATRLLMERFYAHWLDPAHPHTKAEALQLAQADVRARAEFANPRYWAAFQLVGAD